jgi:hypothetical protein
MASSDRHYTERFLRRILRLERAVKLLATQPQLQNSSIDDGTLQLNDTSTGDQMVISVTDITINGESIAPKFKNDSKAIAGPGTQTFHLTYIPITNSEHLYWNGVYQDESQWTRDQWTVTILDPGSVFQSGDELVMEYAYTSSLLEPVEEPGIFYVGSMTIPNGATSVALPGGSALGDLFIVAASSGAGFGNHAVDCTDSRKVDETPLYSYSFGGSWPEIGRVSYGYLTSLGALAVDVHSADGNSTGRLDVYRVTGTVSTSFSHGNTSGTGTFCHVTPPAGTLAIASVATSPGVHMNAPVGWTQDNDGYGGSTYSTSTPGDLHGLSSTLSELSEWVALAIGVT